MAQRKKPESQFSDELIDQLLEGQEHGAHLLGSDSLIGESIFQSEDESESRERS